MAYVAISSNIKSEIRSRIRLMCDQEIGGLGPMPPITVTEDDMEAMKVSLWGEHIGLMALMPHTWKHHFKRVDVGFVDMAEGERTVKSEVQVNVEKLGLYGPPNSTGIYGRNDYVEISSKGLLDPSVRAAEMHFTNVSSVRRRWAKVESQVMHFLDNSKSLNEALKLWPAMANYVPESYMNKVLEKKVQHKSVSRAAEILSKIDTESAEASVVLARMAAQAAA